ncbi:MAG: flagellar hook capping protein [Sphingopyxis sp.]|nr:flagellar hook capping protein [Sphingopyxis sp.]
MTVTSSTPGVPASADGRSPDRPRTLGQADFLRLLTTQLQTQDPFNPTDNTQMIAQMAQFSQVTGIAEINQSLGSIAAMLAQGRNADLSGWIGKSALVESRTAMPMADGYIRGEVSAPAGATGLSIAFLDGAGKLMSEQPIAADATGHATFGWQPPALTAPVTVQLRQNGVPLDASPRIWASVIAVRDPGSASPGVLTTNGNYAPQAVQRLG